MGCFGFFTGHMDENRRLNNVIIDQKINARSIYGLGDLSLGIKTALFSFGKFK